MPGQNTVEFRTIKMNMDKLLLSFKNNISLISLIFKLTSLGLISIEQGRAIRNRYVGIEEQAADLIDIIINKIEENEANYRTFITVLRDSGATYKDVIRNLESTYHEVKTEHEKDLARVEKAGLAYDSSIFKHRRYTDYLYVQQDGSFSTGAEAKIISKTVTRIWAVLNISVTSIKNDITFYKLEEDWKQNSGQGVKFSLENSFLVDKADSKIGSLHGFLLTFVGTSKPGQLGIAFDSLTKMDQWHRALIQYHHVNLLRCRKYPHREGCYIVEICPSSFKLWPVDKTQLGWEWKFSDIESFGWLPLETTLEVDSHRSSETGGGHFRFTGNHAPRLFTLMESMLPRRKLNDYSTC